MFLWFTDWVFQYKVDTRLLNPKASEPGPELDSKRPRALQNICGARSAWRCLPPATLWHSEAQGVVDDCDEWHS